MPAPDLKSLFEGIVTPQALQAQQAAQEQQALQYYAQQSDRPWQFNLERSLNNISAALPNSRQNQALRQAQANEEVLKRSTARYGQMVQEGADPGKAQLDVLDSAISDFAQSGNYEAISALAPTYLALQNKQAELAKLAQEQKTKYAEEVKTRTETETIIPLAQEKLDTGASTRRLQAKQGQKIAAELAKQEGLQIVDLTNPNAGPVVAVVDPKTRQATITDAQGVTKTLKPGQYKEVSAKTGGSGSPMQTKVSEKLENIGKNLDSSEKLVTEFKPSFAGFGTKSTGDIVTDTKRGIFGKDREAPLWWASYESKIQEVRKGLYGANFTATEKEQWERQAVNPGMAPEYIMQRLAAQKAIEDQVAARVARGAAFDYPQEQIETLMGRRLDDLPPAIAPKKGESADKSSAPAGKGSFDYVPGKGLVPKK